MISILLGLMAPSIAIVTSSLGVGIGQGSVGNTALQAINRQPHATSDINRLTLLGCALIETAGIFSMVLALMLILDTKALAEPWYGNLAKLGIGVAIGISSCFASIAGAKPVTAAITAVSHQPFFSTKILNVMLIAQTLIMTPNIFAFLISLLMYGMFHEAQGFNMCLQLLSMGVSIGFGSIGPALGIGAFTHKVCQSLGKNRNIYSKLLSFTFLGSALIETPAIFALLISLSIMTIASPEITFLKALACFASACCIAISTFATGLSSGNIAGAAAAGIAQQPNMDSQLVRLSTIGIAMLDTFPIYGLIIAMLLIFMK